MLDLCKIVRGWANSNCKYQPTIALSSTEANFVAATETGKAILYVRTILEENGLPQKNGTMLHIDNNGALNMANQQQPTKSTRHMELKQLWYNNGSEEIYYTFVELLPRQTVLTQWQNN